MKKKEQEVVLPTEESEDIVAKVVQRVNLFEGYISSKRTEWKKFWRLYRAQLDEPDFDYQTNLAVPYTTAAIETIVPRLVESDTHFGFSGETEEDDFNSKNVNELIEDQTRKDNFELTKIDIFKEAMVLGTSFAKVTWKTKKRTIKRRKPIVKVGGVKIGSIVKTIEKLDIDRAVTEHIPLEKCFWDPFGREVNGDNGCDYFGHIKHISKEKLLQNPNYDKNKVMSIGDEPKTTDPTEDIQLEMSKPLDKENPLIEIIEYWEDDRLVVIANRSVVLRDEPNPYDDKQKPFVRFVDRPVPGQLLGIGEVEFLFGLQTLLNSMTNQAFAVQRVALNKLIFLEKGSGADKDMLISQPFGVHTIDDLTKLKVVDLPGVDPMTVELIMMLKTFMEHVSGISDYSKGTGSANLNDTATGIKLIQDAANYVFRTKIKIAAKMFLKEVGRMLLSRNQQFLNRTYTVKVMNEDGSETYREITNDDIKGNFYVKISEIPPISDQSRQQEALLLRREFMNDPDIDQVKLKKNVLDAFRVDNDVLTLPTAEDVETQQDMTDAEISAEAEDQIMFEGKHITVSEFDDHEIHIVVHEQSKTQADEEVFALLDDHIQEHKAFMSPRIREMMMQEQLNEGGIDEEGLEGELGGEFEGDIPPEIQAELAELPIEEEQEIEPFERASQAGFEGEQLR